MVFVKVFAKVFAQYIYKSIRGTYLKKNGGSVPLATDAYSILFFFPRSLALFVRAYTNMCCKSTTPHGLFVVTPGACRIQITIWKTLLTLRHIRTLIKLIAHSKAMASAWNAEPTLLTGAAWSPAKVY